MCGSSDIVMGLHCVGCRRFCSVLWHIQRQLFHTHRCRQYHQLYPYWIGGRSKLLLRRNRLRSCKKGKRILKPSPIYRSSRNFYRAGCKFRRFSFIRGCAAHSVFREQYHRERHRVVVEFWRWRERYVTNPTHTYNSAGTYTVRLTATGPGGTSGSNASITRREMSRLAARAPFGRPQPARARARTPIPIPVSWASSSAPMSVAGSPAFVSTRGAPTLAHMWEAC